MEPEPDEIVMGTSLGFYITASDLACLLGIVGNMDCDTFDRLTAGSYGEDLEALVVAYDKAKLIFNYSLSDD